MPTPNFKDVETIDKFNRLEAITPQQIIDQVNLRLKEAFHLDGFLWEEITIGYKGKSIIGPREGGG